MLFGKMTKEELEIASYQLLTLAEVAWARVNSLPPETKSYRVAEGDYRMVKYAIRLCENKLSEQEGGVS